MRIFLEISELQHFKCSTDYDVKYVITELLNFYIQFVHDCVQFAWTVELYNCSKMVY